MNFQFTVMFKDRGRAGRFAFPIMVWWGPADYGYYRTFKVLILCFGFIWMWVDHKRELRMMKARNRRPGSWPGDGESLGKDDGC
jgi:hypothetical protein